MSVNQKEVKIVLIMSGLITFMKYMSRSYSSQKSSNFAQNDVWFPIALPTKKNLDSLRAPLYLVIFF